MGVIKQGILGGFSGSVANVVGSSWKGIAVIKSKPLSVANPRTTLQVGNRIKFKAGTSLASKLLVGIIKPLWDRDAQQMSGFNAWVQRNHDYFNSLGEPQYGNLVISKGTNVKNEITEIRAGLSPEIIFVDWEDVPLVGQQLASDKAFIVAVNTTTGETIHFPGSTERSAHSVQMEFENDVQVGEKVEAYLAFQSADGFRLFEQDHFIQA